MYIRIWWGTHCCLLLKPNHLRMLAASMPVKDLIFFFSQSSRPSFFNITSLCGRAHCPTSFCPDYFPPNGAVRLHVWSTPRGRTWNKKTIDMIDFSSCHRKKDQDQLWLKPWIEIVVWEQNLTETGAGKKWDICGCPHAAVIYCR